MKTIVLVCELHLANRTIERLSTDNFIHFGGKPTPKPNHLYPFGIRPPKETSFDPPFIKQSLFATYHLYQDFIFKGTKEKTDTQRPLDFRLATNIVLGNETLFVGMGDMSVLGISLVYNHQTPITLQSIGTTAQYSKPSIHNVSQDIRPKGINIRLTGKPSVHNTSQAVKAFGFDTLGFGDAEVMPRFVYVVGVNDTVVGKPHLYNNRQYVITTGSMVVVFGTSLIEHSEKHLFALGNHHNRFGSHSVYTKNQQILPASINSESIGTPSLQGGVKRVSSTGITDGVIYEYSTGDKYRQVAAYQEQAIKIPQHGYFHYRILSYGLFGTATLTNQNKRLLASGIAGVFGQSVVTHNVQSIAPKGLLSEAMGYVYQKYSHFDTTTQKAVFHTLNWHYPQNHMMAFWRDFERYGWAVGITIYQSPRPIFAKGFDGGLHYDDKGRKLRLSHGLLIGYDVRKIHPYGLDGADFSIASLNRTETVYVKGATALEFPNHTIINKKQAFIVPIGIHALAIGRVIVSPQSLFVRGLDGESIGNATVKDVLPPVIDNTLTAIGTAYTVFGRAWIYGNKKPSDGTIRLSGLLSGWIGDVAIANKNQRVVVQDGIEPPPISNWQTLYNHTKIAQTSSLITPTISPPVIYKKTKLVRVLGMHTGVVGRYSGIGEKTRHIHIKKGIASGAVFGKSLVKLNLHIIKTGNLDFVIIGQSNIALKTQHISPQKIDTQTFGKAWLSHHLRYVETRGAFFEQLGKPFIAHRVRFILPSGIYGDKDGKGFATNHAIGGEQSIYLNGFGINATKWLTRIIADNQTIGVEKDINGAFGVGEIAHNPRAIRPRFFDEQSIFGQLQSYNTVQYVRQQEPYDSALFDGSEFGKHIRVYNKNRSITAYGIPSGRFGYTYIHNNARLIKTDGMAGVFGQAFIAHRRRPINAHSIEQVHFSQWHAIKNATKVINPDGRADSDFGKPSLANTKRYYPRLGGFMATGFGTAFIDFAIRTISIEPRHAINPPTIALPYVGNYTRYITPKGIYKTDRWSGKFGAVSLTERFNKLFIKTNTQEQFGVAGVQNLTPEVKIFGAKTAEFGDTLIYHRWRRFGFFGNILSLVFGQAVIKDRTHKVVMGSGITGVMGQTHRLIKGTSPPYGLQFIELGLYNPKGEMLDGYGITSLLFGTPNTKRTEIHPSGKNGEKFGTVFIVNNALLVDDGIAYHSFGTPKVISPQTITVKQGVPPSTQMGVARLTPHTIYAPMSDRATAQARRNHPSGWQVPIDTMAFGGAMVSNQHRKIYAYGTYQAHFGQLILHLTRRYIRPKGFRFGFLGVPIIPFVLQTIEVVGEIDGKDKAKDATIYGHASISHINAETRQWLRPYDDALTNFGRCEIISQHRFVRPFGTDMAQLGKSKSGDTPFMWQGLRVGEPIYGRYGGFKTSDFGNAFISLAVREVQMYGFESFISEYDITAFKERLYVIRKNLPSRKKVQTINAHGFDNGKVGILETKNLVRYIRPDGNSETFRKGAW